MRWLDQIAFRVKSLFRKERLDAQLSEEIRTHVEMATEAHIAKGMSREEARYAALREFGGVEQIKERARDERGWMWLEQFFQDVRYAVRQMHRSPGFTLVAVLSLAVGIGANTALFSLVDEVLLGSLPVRQPDELVLFRWLGGTKGLPFHGIQGSMPVDRASGRRTSPAFSYAAFERFRAETTTLSEVFTFSILPGASVVIDGRAESVRGQAVSGNYFSGLGARALRGRMLTAADDRPDASPVVVISHDYWQQRFGGMKGIVGKTIQINDVSFAIVGITSRGFTGTGEFGEPASFMLPMAILPQLRGDMGFLRRPLIWWVYIMGRLQPGVSTAAAEAELGPVFMRTTRDAWLAGEPGAPGKSLTGYSLPMLRLTRGDQGLTATRETLARPLAILSCIVVGVLLITCLNVANLLFARSLTRRREIALRLSLGASRGRIIRQLLTESAVLSLTGGALGLLVAYWSRDALLHLWPICSGAFALNFRMLGFVFGVSLATGLLFGLAPAWQATRMSLDAALKTGGAGATGQSRARFRGALMSVQVAIAVVLLIGTGLFLRTLHNFATLDAGFERTHLLYFRIDTSGGHFTPPQRAGLMRRLQENVERLPGVQSVALLTRPLLSGSRSGVRVILGDSGPSAAHANTNEVSPAFFQTLGIPLRAGRTFTEAEVEAGRAVAVVNETFARAYFPGENPVDRSFVTPGSTVFKTPDRQVEIIGVAADALYADLRTAIPPTIYNPLTNLANGTFVVRTVGEPRALADTLRKALGALAPDAALRDVRTQEETINQLLASERLFAVLCSIFACVALALTCLGLFGLLSHEVAARTREIGLRLALGAPVRAVVVLVVRGGMKLVLAGLVLGLAAAYMLTRFIAALLFNVPPTDPATFAGVGLLLMFVALLACWLPARRAAKVDPMEALRCE